MSPRERAKAIIERFTVTNDEDHRIEQWAPPAVMANVYAELEVAIAEAIAEAIDEAVMEALREVGSW